MNKIAEKRLKIIEKQKEDKFKLQIENRVKEEKLMCELDKYLSNGICPKCGGNVKKNIFKGFFSIGFEFTKNDYKCKNCNEKYKIKLRNFLKT
jgi:hypothetical protein